MTSAPRDGDFELVTLRNGSRAVRSLSLGEVMHPSVGPWKEANLLYVEQLGLAQALAQPGASPLFIYDVGLGAATNAAAALECAKQLGTERRRELTLVSLERDLAPLRLALGDPDGFPFLAPWAAAAHALMQRGDVSPVDGVRWLLREGDALEQLSGAPAWADRVFFDPFSPASNPELWTVDAFTRVRQRCAKEVLLATYSAATPTRVALLLAGFYVGAGVGVGTKQETTIAALEPQRLVRPLDARWLERWKRSSARAPHGEVLTPEHERALLAHPQFAARIP